LSPIFLFVAVGLGAPALKDPPKEDLPSLVGEWDVKSRMVGGQRKDPVDGSTVKFTADGGAKFTGGPSIAGTYTADPTKDPAEFDIKPSATTTAPGLTGIYRVDGDTLILCLIQKGPRPTKFESPPGSRVLLFTVKRVAKKD
jgi:uncharacterized protein (TIGR03067 family)